MPQERKGKSMRPAMAHRFSGTEKTLWMSALMVFEKVGGGGGKKKKLKILWGGSGKGY